MTTRYHMLQFIRLHYSHYDFVLLACDTSIGPLSKVLHLKAKAITISPPCKSCGVSHVGSFCSYIHRCKE